MASRFKLLVLERASLDKNQLEQLLKGYLPGLHRERAHDILVEGATLPASVAESDKEGDVRRVKASLEKAGFAVCVVEDTSLGASFGRTAETGRKIVGFLPDLLRGVREVFTRRREDPATRGDGDGWVPAWMPSHLRGIWVVALPALLLLVIGGVWVLFTVQVEGPAGGSALTLPDWTGVSSQVVEPGIIKAGFAFAFGTVLGWTLVPFLGSRKKGKKKGFLLILGLLGGVFLAVLLATLAPWRTMIGGDQDGGAEMGTGGDGGDMRPEASGSELGMDSPETAAGPATSGESDGSFVGFVNGLQGPVSPCDPELSAFAGLLCELKAMGPPPEGFSPDDPDALSDMLTSSFEEAGDDDSAGDDDDSAGDGVAEGSGGGGDHGSTEPREPETDRDTGEDEQPQENSLAAPGSAGGKPAPGRRGGGGGGGGSPDESELEQLDEEDRIGEDEPMDSPTRNIFRGEAPGEDSSIPQGYTREGMQSRPDEDETRGTLSDETAESPMRDQAVGPVSLLVGLVLGGGLSALRRRRRG
jgi:hypothetical protein